MKASEDILIKDYLNLFSVSQKRFIVGIFQEGITIYKQQIRALNILYGLIESQKIKAGDKIAIVGGGIAGLTIASAALFAGINVVIYEEKEVFLSVQYGCDIRTIHPYFYDWPESKSLLPYTDLPVLNWRSSTASSVCKTIYSAYKRTKDLQQDFVTPLEYKGAKIEFIRERNGTVEIQFVFNNQRVEEKVDILIYATGYGIETGSMASHYTPSYWRNDEHGQLRLETKEKKYYISGTGDGALLDIFRIKIRGFSIESMISDLKADKNGYENLVNQLSKIKNEWNLVKLDDSVDWLFTKFETIANLGILDYFFNKLKDKERIDNKVMLNIKAKSFNEILNLGKISFFNAFVIYCLYKKNFFEYTLENMETSSKGNTAREQRYLNLQLKSLKKKYDYLIIRHGTSKKEALIKVNLSTTEIANLEGKQLMSKSIVNNASKRWPIGWWSKLFSSFKGEDYLPSIEFFTPDTLSVCSNFISVLSKVIEYFLVKKGSEQKEFRVTLHRIIQISGELFFQQISDYYGNEKEGQVGRVFPLSGGVVGYVARTGKTIILEKKGDDEFNAVYESLSYQSIGARELSREVSSIMAIPIFGKLENDEYATNLVLYLDSSEPDFFHNNKEQLSLIVKATEGFIQSISRLIMSGKITMAELEFNPALIINKAKIELVENSGCFTDISKQLLTNHNDGLSKPLLTFDKFYSFNILLDNEQDPFQ